MVELIRQNETDTVVIGGGLAGLTAAARLGQGGQRVLLLEKGREPGGRAQTRMKQEFLFNLGPHALYRAGAGADVLRKMGIPLEGGTPSSRDSLGAVEGRLVRFPAEIISLLKTRFLGLGERLKLAFMLKKVADTRPEEVEKLTVTDWLASHDLPERVRQVLLATMRVATYADAPEQMSAAVFVQQIQLTIEGGVLYLDGGWQTLVDGLVDVARTAGVQILSGRRVESLREDDQGVKVQLAGGRELHAAHAVLAVDPATAGELLEDNSLQRWAKTGVPVRAAILDVALRRLPQPGRTFVLGLDEPLYLSVHSNVAQLAPADGALIHLAHYLPVEGAEPDNSEGRLENLLDLAQPGWRELLVHRRFLPSMTVVNRLVTAAEGGFAGRPGPALAAHPRCYLAGDWVGSDGWLADASLASGRQAAEMILQEGLPALHSGERQRMPVPVHAGGS